MYFNKVTCTIQMKHQRMLERNQNVFYILWSKIGKRSATSSLTKSSTFCFPRKVSRRWESLITFAVWQWTFTNPDPRPFPLDYILVKCLMMTLWVWLHQLFGTSTATEQGKFIATDKSSLLLPVSLLMTSSLSVNSTNFSPRVWQSVNIILSCHHGRFDLCSHSGMYLVGAFGISQIFPGL